MNISGFEIYQYQLPLRRAFSIVDQSLTNREGLIVRLAVNDGLSGVGEVAPLPGFSHETLKKAAFQLNALRSEIIGQEIPTGLDTLRVFMNQKFNDDFCPSVRFGVESAMVHLISQKNATSVAKMLGCREVKNILIAGLLQGTVDEIISQAQQLIGQNCEVFKLKIGNRNIPLDVRKVQVLREIIGPHRKIRLDANRAWSLNEAITFAQNTGKENIEFIEEPLKEVAGLSDFIRETGFPVALDESIDNVLPDEFNFPDGVSCVVIKPTRVGGVLKTLDWIAKASQKDKGVIISSCFESGIGLRVLASLAACTTFAAGLGTDQWFSQDLMSPIRAQNTMTIPVSELKWDWKDIRCEIFKRIS